MLDKHLEETGALVPRPNPAYMPGAAKEIAQWRPSGQCWLALRGGLLLVTSTGGDPFISNNAVPEASGKLEVRFRMRSKAAGAGQFFWSTRGAKQFGPEQRLDFSPRHDGNWEEHTIAFEAATPLEAIRIDPGTAPGAIEFEWIALDAAEDSAKNLYTWRFAGL